MLNIIKSIYPTGVERAGKKAHYENTHTKKDKNQIVNYANKHTLDKACKKFNVCRGTLAGWLTDHNKAVY